MKTSDSSTKRVLVVEDEPSISDVCRRVLTGEGLEVDIAGNGIIAQDMVENKHYDYCLIDIRTPEMNGTELYQWLKEEHPQLTEGVIFTTGGIMGGDTMTFIEQCGRPFLPKPLTPDELRAIFQKMLEGGGK